MYTVRWISGYVGMMSLGITGGVTECRDDCAPVGSSNEPRDRVMHNAEGILLGTEGIENSVRYLLE